MFHFRTTATTITQMAQARPTQSGGLHLDSMIRVEPFECLDGYEGELKTKAFFNDVAKFMAAKGIGNGDIVKEIVPYLRGRAETLYMLSKAKRRYLEYNVEIWNPILGTPLVPAVRDENNQIISPEIPAVEAVPKTLKTLLEEQLIREISEDTIRDKIETTGTQTAGEPFIEYADRIRLLVYHLHTYTYTSAQRDLDVNHVKEFQETIVLLKKGTFPKLWDFLVAQNYVQEAVRTEATFVRALEGAKVWENSAEGRAFLASRQRPKPYQPTPAPVIPTLAQPISTVVTRGRRGPRGRGRGRGLSGRGKPPGIPRQRNSRQGSNTPGETCTYCGIKNHLSVDCRRRNSDIAKGIYRDKAEGYPLKSWYERKVSNNSPGNPNQTPTVSSIDWNNSASTEWQSLGHPTHNPFETHTPQHGPLQANRCSKHEN